MPLFVPQVEWQAGLLGGWDGSECWEREHRGQAREQGSVPASVTLGRTCGRGKEDREAQRWQRRQRRHCARHNGKSVQGLPGSPLPRRWG